MLAGSPSLVNGDTRMKAIAGALVALAGAVLVAAGTVADGMMRAANRNGDPGAFTTIVGVGVGALGLALLAAGWMSESPGRPPHPPDRPAPPPPV